MAGGWMSRESERETAPARRRTKGSFTRSAERAGKSVHELAEERKHMGGKQGARARMALMYEKAGK
jgi:hypothetical protein